MKLEGVWAEAVRGELLEVLGEIDDAYRRERALLHTDPTPNAKLFA